MVHINTRYVNVDGTLDDDYAVNPDGVAVLGFLFTAKWAARVHTNFVCTFLKAALVLFRKLITTSL